MRWIATLGAGLLSVTAAHAAEGLAWSWEDGVSRTYLLGVDVKMADVLFIQSTVNRDSRIQAFALDMVTTCVGGDPVGKRGWGVRCTIDEMSIRFDPMPTDVGALDPLAKELDELYTGKPIVFTMLRDGRIRSVEIEGVDQLNRRVNQLHQPFRAMVQRALAPLEVRLPKKGDDRGLGRWTAVGSLAMGFPSEFGTIGRAELRLRLEGPPAERVEIITEGQGTLGTGEVVMVNGTERPRNLYEMRLTSTATFDTEGGFLVRQAYSTNGEASASSARGEGRSGVHQETAEARLIDPGSRVQLPESGERELGTEPTGGQASP